MISVKELKEYAKACQKHGIKKLKLEGLEIDLELSQESIESQAAADASPLPELTDEDVLLWSSNAVLNE